MSTLFTCQFAVCVCRTPVRIKPKKFAFCACPNFESYTFFYTFFFKTLSLNMVLGIVFKSVKKKKTVSYSGWKDRGLWERDWSYCKILKRSPWDYIFQRPYLEGLLHGGAYWGNPFHRLLRVSCALPPALSLAVQRRPSPFRRGGLFDVSKRRYPLLT